MTATDEAMVTASRFFNDDEAGMISNTLKRVTKNFVPQGIFICLPLWVATIGNEPNFAVSLCCKKMILFRSFFTSDSMDMSGVHLMRNTCVIS
jgi:hypothetical protein